MNDNVIIKLIDLINNWPASIQLLGFLILLNSIAFSMFEKYRNAIIDLIYVSLRIAKDNPLKHPFFLQKSLLLLQIDNIDFRDDDKNWIFKTILRIKFEVTFELLFNFIKAKKWKKENKYKLQAELLLLVKRIIDTYESKILNAFIEKYKSKGEAIFNLIYNGEEGFKQHHSRNVENIISNINKIFIVESYNNTEIVNSFILQIWVALDVAINDCVLAFKNINGQLKKLIEDAKI